ncbi:hypothetical protein BC629DRAFT_332084 [Irpex lacteus]|nr:hypothetical protein BC629DRAFT_332084 [Irpex lacteus]
MTGPRRSQRLQVGRSPNAGTDSDSINPTVERDSEVTKTPKTKKRKIGHEKKNTGKKTGQLQSMLDMPLDIVLEICSYLHPKDLLHLARSTKGLRRFFMSKESLPFWKAARLAATEPRLPPCPEDMCEPAFINLLLDTHCHNCLKPNCQDVYLACRVRLCKACFAKKSIPVDDCNLIIDAETLQVIEPRELQDVIPTLRKSWHGI